jgi:hypothetical protein
VAKGKAKANPARQTSQQKVANLRKRSRIRAKPALQARLEDLSLKRRQGKAVKETTKAKRQLRSWVGNRLPKEEEEQGLAE